MSLSFLFDFKDPHSYLAMGPMLNLADEATVESRWYPFLIAPLRAPAPLTDDADRGTRHRWQRSRYLLTDIVRYAEAQGLPARHFNEAGVYRSLDGELAALGFNWASGDGGAVARRFLKSVFEGCWDGDLALDSQASIEAALTAAGAEIEGFDVYCQGPGLEELVAQRESLVAQGAFTTPTCLFGGEAYVGRQHLPLIRWKLENE